MVVVSDHSIDVMTSICDVIMAFFTVSGYSCYIIVLLESLYTPLWQASWIQNNNDIIRVISF